MTDILPNPTLLPTLAHKTVLITGAANGIGAATARLFHAHGANVLIADLESTRSDAEALVAALQDEQKEKESGKDGEDGSALGERRVGGQGRAVFHATDVTEWQSLQAAFKMGARTFGQIDIVVANAGVMERKRFWDFEVDEEGDLKESSEAGRVLDVNLRGGMNTLRLAMFYMSKNSLSSTNTRGSIILVTSTSGYFGGTGVPSYIASKHGLTGLLRSSQPAALKHAIRLNAVVPFVTPTQITGSYFDKWHAAGLPSNEPSDVATAIAMTAADQRLTGNGILVAAKRMRELEAFYTAVVPEWLGPETTELMQRAGKFFEELGGYPLPA